MINMVTKADLQDAALISAALPLMSREDRRYILGLIDGMQLKSGNLEPEAVPDTALVMA